MTEDVTANINDDKTSNVEEGKGNKVQKTASYCKIQISAENVLHFVIDQNFSDSHREKTHTLLNFFMQ